MYRLIKKADNNLKEQVNPYTDLPKEKQRNNTSKNISNIDPKVISEVNQILDRIKESSNNLKDIYYSLFDNLNALFAAYPSIYQQLQMTVKLPTNKDAMNTVVFNNDLMQILNKFKDQNYLATYLQNSSETKE